MTARILVKFFWATLAVVLSYVAVFVATLVESGGFGNTFGSAPASPSLPLAAS